MLYIWSYKLNSQSIKEDQNMKSLAAKRKTNLSITKQALLGLIALVILMWIVLFLPAGSLNYWAAWIYWLSFFSTVTVITIYFLKNDLTLIAGRLKAGPTAETQTNQKVTQAFASIFFILILLIPPLDYRFQWSAVPFYIVIISDAFVVLGLVVVFFVFKENTSTSAIIDVNKNQTVVSTGPYRVVRHPMYSGALLMLLFTPLALGSFWGLLAFFPMLLVIGFRLVEEEKFLEKSLPGYEEYTRKTQYRLIPWVW
jgi:protein-S-isoprenylcysteine O-methyltransferase Ste14